MSSFQQRIRADRDKQMKNSPQLTLGELIKLLEKVKDKKSPIITSRCAEEICGLISWRGSYNELSISSDDWNSDDWGKPLNAGEFLQMCIESVGKTFVGYKGGDFKMYKRTPVWVANYGQCGSMGNGCCGVTGVKEIHGIVIILCGECPYL